MKKTIKNSLEKVVDFGRGIGKFVRRNKKKGLITFLLPLMIGGSVQGKKIRVSTGLTDVGDSQMKIEHKVGADELYNGSDDSFWSSAPNNPNPTWLKVYSDPYGEELMKDARPEDSVTPYHLKISVVGDPATTFYSTKFEILDHTNFTWKNLFAEQYGLGDVNEPNDIEASYDVKGAANEWLNGGELTNYSEGIFDNWMVKFYNHADLDRDGDVDFGDYAIWADNYGRADTMPRDDVSDIGAYADIDRNGVVDLKDLSDFSSQWLWDPVTSK